MHARATDECCQNALKSDFSYKVFVFRSMGNELVPLPHNIRNGSYIRHNRLSVYQLYVIFIHVLFKTMFSLISIRHSRSKNWKKKRQQCSREFKRLSVAFHLVRRTG